MVRNTVVDQIPPAVDNGQMAKKSEKLTAITERMREENERLREYNKIEAAQELAVRIAMVRRAAGWSQTQLGAQVGVSRGAVAQWEGGSTEPTASNLREIAVKASVDYDWLATGRGQPPSPSPQTSGALMKVELTIRLPEKTSLSEVLVKIDSLKAEAEQYGEVSGQVIIGGQKFEL
jgi:transcriptional regulator with XRE-family HTH domain